CGDEGAFAAVPPEYERPRSDVLIRYCASAGGPDRGRRRIVTSHSPFMGSPYLARQVPPPAGDTMPRLSMRGIAPIAGMLTSASTVPCSATPTESRAPITSVLLPT